MKLDVLDAVSDEVDACEACELHAGRINAVFARGSIKDVDNVLMFVGEAPGAEEDELGQPFVGPSGTLLDEIIEKMKLESYYICNAVKCRPPDNRAPTDEELGACSMWLETQIEVVDPLVIVALGKTAALALGCDTGKGWAGRWGIYNGIPVMPTYHPAYLLRQENPKPVWRRVSKHLLEAKSKLR